MIKNFTHVIKWCATLFVCLICVSRTHAQFPTLFFQQRINSGLTAPIDIVNAGDGSNRVFVVQQNGIIKVYDQSLTSLGDFLTVTGITYVGGGDERGLLSLAFHPNYSSNRYFFVWYAVTVPGPDTTATNDDTTYVHLDRFQTRSDNPNVADPNSRLGILSIKKPVGFTNHNGANINFGPDGYLYIGTGDGGSGNDPFNNAQNGNSLLGKMLRIDVNNPNPPFYSIPPDNPYINDPNVLDEIWALGLRNPWRWTFDKLTHDMWIADVGQSAREEVNFRPAGSGGGINFGWRCFEGMISTPGVPDCTPANYVPPIFDYTHDFATGGIAITGGYVYRGTEFPSLYGYYVASDWSSGNVWVLHSDGTSHRQSGNPTSLTSFGEAEDGTLYAAAGNSIYKVGAVAQSPTPIKLISFTLKQEHGFNDLNWQTAMEYNVKEFRIQYSADAISFSDLTSVGATNNQNGSSYSFRHFTNNDKRIYYRLNTVDIDGKSEFSKVISTSEKTGTASVRILSSSNTSMWLEISGTVGSLRIVNAYGQIMQRTDKINGSGLININTSNWNKGIYFLIIQDSKGHTTTKFLKD